METSANAMTTTKPFYLFIGRKRHRINKPFQIEARNELSNIGDDLMPRTVIRSTTYQLFLDGKLFASAVMRPKQRYGHAPLRIIKPKRGLPQIHIVKKYWQLAE